MWFNKSMFNELFWIIGGATFFAISAFVIITVIILENS